MANPVLEGIGRDITQINKNIEEAEEIIQAMKEAGEDTATLEQDLKTLRIRKGKWEQMLINRGISVN